MVKGKNRKGKGEKKDQEFKASLGLHETEKNLVRKNNNKVTLKTKIINLVKNLLDS